nr:hypothetical protein [Tanacetum cinerariifolium]
MMPPTNNRSTKDVQPLVVQVETLVPNYEPVVALIVEPVVSPISAPKPNPKPSIPYLSRLHDQKLHDKTSDQKDKFFKIFQDLDFNISFADALILMPKFGPTIKDKLMDEYLALTDLSASINLMPFSLWNKLSLPELTPTLMTLKLADRSVSRPIGVAEDVFVKVGKFHFSTDFVVVDIDADPRVPLILERSFLKTGKALIDIYKGELTLRVGKEAITFNLDMTANRIEVIDMAYEEYSQEVLDFSEEVDDFLALEDDLTSPEVDQFYYDPEGDILLLEAFLNDDPSLPPPTQGIGSAPKKVNPKIHDVIKKEVLKLLNAGLIYPISDSPWVSPVHCVPKNGGFTVVGNEENELIPTRLVTRWATGYVASNG